MSPAPDVIHVGFSKCASTFLQTFFRQHPEIFLIIKSHFFTPFEHCDIASSAEKYYGLFKDAQPDQIRLESDEHILLPLHHPVLESAATTLESVSEVSRRIKSVQRNAKIIMVVRNQVSLIVSRYSEYLLAGGKLEFDDFVGEFLVCSEDGVNYYQNYYSQILEIFQADFSPDNVLLLLQEELRTSEQVMIEDLCTFLGIPLREARGKDPRSKRAGLSPVGMKMMRSMNRLLVRRPAKSYRRASVKGPYFIYKICQIFIRTIDYYLPKLIKGDKKELLNENTVARIREQYSEDNARLAGMLRKDLVSLGY